MLCFQLDPGDITKTGYSAVFVTIDDDFGKFLGRFETPVNIDRQLELHTGIIRRAANRSRRDLYVLALNGRNNIARGQAAFGNLVRVKPDAHRVITRPEQTDLPDALDAG